MALYNRARGYIRKNEYDRAIDDYSEAIRIDPSDKNFFNNRGVAFTQKGDYDSAMRDYDQAIHLDPNDELATPSDTRVSEMHASYNPCMTLKFLYIPSRNKFPSLTY